MRRRELCDRLTDKLEDDGLDELTEEDWDEIFRIRDIENIKSFLLDNVTM
jgi:hypothetical protein